MKQDLLTLQDQIYAGLVAALDLKLSNEERAKGATHLTENIGAYETYLKGRNLLRAGQRDGKVLKQALDLFDGATQKELSALCKARGIDQADRGAATLARAHEALPAARP